MESTALIGGALQTDSSLLLQAGLQMLLVWTLGNWWVGVAEGFFPQPLSGSEAFLPGSDFLEPLLTHMREHIHRKDLTEALRGHFGPLSA